MIDLHTHTIFSDGELIPSELVRRAQVAGYRGLALTDHGDASNIDFIIPRIVKVCRKLQASFTMRIIPGIELTHIPPVNISKLAQEARKLGAKLVLVHGESIAEPVAEGTNHAAIEAQIDILAHPGLISDEDVQLAASKGIYLEISTRRGHSLTNGHVAKGARKYHAPLVINTDAHAPGDLVSMLQAESIAAGAGLSERERRAIFRNSAELLEKISY